MAAPQGRRLGTTPEQVSNPEPLDSPPFALTTTLLGATRSAMIWARGLGAGRLPPARSQARGTPGPGRHSGPRATGGGGPDSLEECSGTGIPLRTKRGQKLFPWGVLRDRR